MAQHFVMAQGRKSGKCEVLRHVHVSKRIIMNPDLLTCPECDGNECIWEDGCMVQCPLCHGVGMIDKADYQQWINDEIDINEARRRYERQFTED